MYTKKKLGISPENKLFKPTARVVETLRRVKRTMLRTVLPFVRNWGDFGDWNDSPFTEFNKSMLPPSPKAKNNSVRKSFKV